MNFEEGLTKISITDWAHYDFDENSAGSLKLVEPSEPMPDLFGSLIEPQEVWIFFSDPVNAVAVDIYADWSEITQQGVVTSGAEIYAYTGFDKTNLPPARGPFQTWNERPQYWAYALTKIPLGSTGSLFVNKDGITAVMVKVWEGGLQDNSIKVGNIYTDCPNLNTPLNVSVKETAI